MHLRGIRRIKNKSEKIQRDFFFFFKFTRELSVRARTEGEDSLNILYKTHYLRLQAHLSDSILSESALSRRRIKKASTLGFGDKRGISECFKMLTSGARKKKQHNRKKTPKKQKFQRTSASSSSRGGRERRLARQTGIVCCETPPLRVKDVLPLFSFRSPAMSTRATWGVETHHASGFRGANTFSLATLK